MKKLLLPLLLIGIGGTAQAAERIKAPLVNAKGQEIGTATFSPTPKGVKVSIKAMDLPPGLHGIHVHDKGLCDGAKAFESAGGHFAPHAQGHGLLSQNGPHAGDLPNLEVKADGTAKWEGVLKKASLASDETISLIKTEGTSLIIHAGADDQATSPSGNSGDRIACAVIHKGTAQQ